MIQGFRLSARHFLWAQSKKQKKRGFKKRGGKRRTRNIFFVSFIFFFSTLVGWHGQLVSVRQHGIMCAGDKYESVRENWTVTVSLTSDLSSMVMPRVAILSPHPPRQAGYPTRDREREIERDRLREWERARVNGCVCVFHGEFMEHRIGSVRPVRTGQQRAKMKQARWRWLLLPWQWWSDDLNKVMTQSYLKLCKHHVTGQGLLLPNI